MDQITFEDLFHDEKKVIKPNQTNNQSPIQMRVLELLNSGETSALAISEKLIDMGLFNKKRYITNKPRCYAEVCLILDELVLQGFLRFIEDIEKKDRVYELVKE
ncbi:DUF3895 domain-containing protein [Metabacillus niabensis]|uniref:DUF3895 domain-containing protein n=1 Tax=Metabacillus niabensis TaxID=324854 RepID=UPI00399F0A04